MVPGRRTAIAGATKDSLDISTAGTYTVKVDGTQDPYGVACPLVVTKAPCASIGDFVWEDLDGDGQQDASETGTAGVKVYLYDATTGLKFDSAVTRARGAYVFTEVPSRNFYVQVATSTLPQNPRTRRLLQPPPQTPDADATDTDIKANGSYGHVQLRRGAGDKTDVDAGFVPRANVGDYVWVDANRNGMQDLGEAAVVGASAKLVNTTTGLTVAHDHQRRQGRYLFNAVPFGNYRVDFDYTTAQRLRRLPLHADRRRDHGYRLGCRPDDRAQAAFGFDARTGDDLTRDAGIFAHASIGDRVFADANNDGVRQPGEGGVEGVTVRLYDNSGTVVATTITDANGNYLLQ